VIVMFTSSGRTDLGDYVAALLAGPLLSGSVGLGLWRAAGLVLGQLASALTARCLLSQRTVINLDCPATDLLPQT
jgi:hypothetical protein